ncbi:hypothetical protein Y032_0003g1367 [Ancylostoma ceylanicum]|uniref:BPL/LPL catalytic domain-containing protein n=1 Tax=Ancylostoma ceylanicum TaxID=53326 RepID=A0A016VXD7_9BILA|nr:hypothetical protein Y032_0003g1367 [Ancylostoma ceylanicum]
MCDIVRHRLGKIYVSLSTCIFKNLAFEEYLLRHHDLENDGDAMLLWSNKPAVVIGRHQNPWLEANIPFLREYGIDLARRHSGGGTVYHDEGNLNISLLTTRKAHCRKKNLEFLAKAINDRFKVNVVPTSRDDMELQPGSRKCSGTAARITTARAYHHLTLLVNADLLVLSTSLRSPYKEYINTNASRSVRAPAVGFLKQDDASAEVSSVRETVIQQFSERFKECVVTDVDVDEELKKNEQVVENLSFLKDWNWIFGKTPKFWFENGSRKQYVEAGIIKEWRSVMWTARHALGRVALHSTRRIAASAPRPLSIAHVVTSRHLCVTSTRFCAAAAPERHEFQAETKNLMDIVAKSLYSDSEVFVRELISNASDALEKRRCVELTGQIAEGPSEIRVTTDEGHRTITFEDTGIGMDRRELLECLGTIAKSGSKEFIEKNKDNAEAVIGQFGVGFYSAFMVADSVVVTTRKVGEPEEKGLKWTWKGDNSYEVSEEKGLPTGTRIVIHLKPGDSAEYSKAERVKEVIDKYSYFVAAPILLNGERVNSLNAIWTLQPKDVTKEMHETFFKQLAKQQKKSEAFQRPCYTIHYKTDTPVSLRSVLYIPQHRFSMLEYAAQAHNRDCGLSLYARRVLIKPNAKELLPNYLHFVMGVVDSEDIPLNLSREMLQNNPVLRKLRKILTDKVLSFLQNEMKKDNEKYEDFYKQYSIFLKEGIVTQVDHSEKEEIAKLMLFESSNLKAGVLTNLTEYCKRMQEDQKEIYYMFSPSRQLAESSPYYELVRSQNKEVLFLYEPADEVVFLALHQFNMKPLVGVEKWAESAASKGEDKDKAEGKQFRDVDKKELLDWIKSTLGSVKVFDIAGNHRPSEHPVMLTIKHEMGAARHLLRTGEIKDLEHLVFLQPCLHVNLSHPLIKSLYTMKRTDPKTAELLISQIYDNALITSGLLKDTSGMVQRLNKLLTQLAGSKSTILTP